MYQVNALKERFRTGGQAYGAWLNACSPIVAELMAHAGYDCLMIDREHSPGDLLNAVNLMNAIRTTPTTALMRVPDGNPAELKRVLDTGIEGIMFPAVSSAAEARGIVAACRYPPHGFRGYAAGVSRAADYGFKTELYKRTATDNFLLICQIETAGCTVFRERNGSSNVRPISAKSPNDASQFGMRMRNGWYRTTKFGISDINSAYRT